MFVYGNSLSAQASSPLTAVQSNWRAPSAQNATAQSAATATAHSAPGATAHSAPAAARDESEHWVLATANYADATAPSATYDSLASATAAATTVVFAADPSALQVSAATAGAQLASLGAHISRHRVELNPFKIGSSAPPN